LLEVTEHSTQTTTLKELEAVVELELLEVMGQAQQELLVLVVLVFQ
jgi:hypothetical protein